MKSIIAAASFLTLAGTGCAAGADEPVDEEVRVTPIASFDPQSCYSNSRCTICSVPGAACYTCDGGQTIHCSETSNC